MRTHLIKALILYNVKELLKYDLIKEMSIINNRKACLFRVQGSIILVPNPTLVILIKNIYMYYFIWNKI